MKLMLMILADALWFRGWSTMGEPEPGRRVARTTISCAVSGDWGDKIAFRETRTMAMHLVYTAQYRDGMVHLPAYEITGEGTLQVPGSPLLHVSWEKDRCTTIEEPPPREVCGEVKNGGPWPVVNVISASGMSHADVRVGGKFCARVAEEGPYGLHVSRGDAWLITGADVQIEDANQPWVVQLPERRQGGLGVLAAKKDDGGFVVERVVPGMAAAKAGIRPGDVLHVTEPVVGDVGSRVRVEWQSDEGPRVADLRRQLFAADPTIVSPTFEDGAVLTTNKILPHQVMF